MSFIKNQLSEKFNLKTDELNLVKVRGGGGGKILFFVFLGRQKSPFLCAKMSSLEYFNPLIESEFDNLKSARNSLPDNLKTTIPKPLELMSVNGCSIGLEEFVSGRQAGHYMGFADLEKVFNWLCQFHKANIIGKEVVSKDFLIDMILKYNLREKTDNYVLEILEIWGDRSVEMPIIKQHGDFHFANIFFREDALKVIDWANYGKVILPAYDLLFFLKRQRGGIESNKKIIVDYFNYFSIPKEVLDPWVKIFGVIENLEKWSRKK